MEPVDVVHYHDSMSPSLLPQLVDTLRPAHPEVAAWLEPQGPIEDPGARGKRIVREAFRLKRAGDRRLYYARHGFTKSMQTIR